MLRRQLRLGTSAPVFPWNEVSRYSRVVSVAAIREGNSEPKLAASNQRSTCGNLIWLSATLFSSTLSRQSLLQALLLARLQVVGVTLHFLNDVFRLNLALEPTQGILPTTHPLAVELLPNRSPSNGKLRSQRIDFLLCRNSLKAAGAILPDISCSPEALLSASLSAI
jgi:hypothetical protein